jgi:hypothetical protein
MLPSAAIGLGLAIVGVLVTSLIAYRREERETIRAFREAGATFVECGASGHLGGPWGGLGGVVRYLTVVIVDERLIVRPGSLLASGLSFAFSRLALDIPLSVIHEIHISRFIFSYQVVVTYANSAGRKRVFTLYVDDAHALAKAIRASASPPRA